MSIVTNTNIGNVADFDKELAELRAKMAELATKRQEAAKAQEAAVFAKIAELPEQFGQPNVSEVYKLIGSYLRAQQNGNPSAGRKIVTDEQKATIRKLLTDKKQVTVIAAETNVSVPTVMKIKEEMGLVNKRKASTPATTEAAATA